MLWATASFDSFNWAQEFGRVRPVRVTREREAELSELFTEGGPVPSPFHARPATSRRGPAEFWSRFRLQFDSKSLTSNMKRAIISTVIPLEAHDGEALRGIYVSPIRDSVDTENVLFYNVGAGAFSRAARYGLRFERCFSACPECVECPEALHHHVYELVDSASEFAHWIIGRRLASWEGLPHPVAQRVHQASRDLDSNATR